MRESTLERRVRAAAGVKGWLTYKWASVHHRGVPDCIFIRAGDVFFVEFKAPGRKPTPLQARVHERLRREGARVFVIDSVEAACRIFGL